MKEIFAKFNEFREKIQNIPRRIEEFNNKVDFSSNRYQEIMIDLEGMTTHLAQSDFFFFCEFIENTIKTQNQENEQLKARVAELESLLESSIFHDNRYGHFPDDFYNKAKALLTKKPKQSLAEIKAEAIKEYLPLIKAMDEPSYVKGRFASEMFWRGAFASQDLATAYANQLQAEGE